MGEERGAAFIWWRQPWLWIIVAAIILIIIFGGFSGSSHSHSCK